MCVVSHSYGGLGGGKDGGGSGRHAGQSKDGLSACMDMSERGDDTRSHRLPGAKFWVGSSRNWLVFRGRS